ncbi:hypothetical protein R6Q59_035523 [Mikania micrantha]|uniref:GRAM domain-containing protein n=1 Tax=Mikania micrantha TaxID=192012 RepID=A0A5N6NE10_9ASTR|nr:hypothetical protein E3N88_23707 [Mikania micrantha]
MNPKQSSNPSQESLKSDGSHSGNDDPNPNADRNDSIPPFHPATGNHYTSVGQPSQTAASTTPQGPNPYVSAVPVRDSSTKNGMDSVKALFGRWAKKASEATKKGQEYAEDMLQHLKTGSSITDAAVGRIAQGTKVLAEGGYEKIFRTTFQNTPEEQLLKSYACYLSTSAGPVMGLLYISTAKLAFCSDNPLPYKVGEDKKWSYYKVVMPLLQLKAVKPSRSKSNPAEKYIQVISVDDHEFWFMGFVNYDSAVKTLQGALDPHQYPLCIGTSNC